MDNKLKSSTYEALLNIREAQLSTELNKIAEQHRRKSNLTEAVKHINKKLLKKIRNWESWEVSVDLQSSWTMLSKPEYSEELLSYLTSEWYKNINFQIRQGEKIWLVPPDILTVSFNIDEAINQWIKKVAYILKEEQGLDTVQITPKQIEQAKKDYEKISDAIIKDRTMELWRFIFENKMDIDTDASSMSISYLWLSLDFYPEMEVVAELSNDEEFDVPINHQHLELLSKASSLIDEYLNKNN